MSYYKWNGQAGDWPALLLYARFAKRYFGSGRVLDFGSGAGFLLRRLSWMGAAILSKVTIGAALKIPPT